MPASKALQAKLRAKWPAILALLADGVSLRKISAMEGMPCRNTLRNWLAESEEAGSDMMSQYMRAKRWGAEDYADEIVEIADSVDPADSAAVNKARLQVDTRKWIASKLAPKYADRIDVNHGGSVTSAIQIGVPLQRPGAHALGAADLGAARVVAEAAIVKTGALVEGGDDVELPDAAPADEPLESDVRE